jgi:hypothetical protein
MKLLNIYLIAVLGFACILFTIAFIEKQVNKSKENKFTRWWRNHIIGDKM